MFDTIIAVDWSAANTPKRGANSIWIATSNGLLANPATRIAAEQLLIDLLAADSGRVLVGIDVSLGYPVGTAGALGLNPGGRGVWFAIWELIAALSTDDDRNRNNRFDVAAELNRRLASSTGASEGPFWGRPPSFNSRSLAPTKPAHFGPLAEFRATEQWLRDNGHSPKSVWQLLGAGSVGSQTLTAIPMLHRLVTNDDQVSVWPFMGPRQIVIAEVWPSLYLRPKDVPPNTVADAAQVLAVVEALRDVAQLPDLEASAAVAAEEGWVLTKR